MFYVFFITPQKHFMNGQMHQVMTSDKRIHKNVCEAYKRLHLDYVYAY